MKQFRSAGSAQALESPLLIWCGSGPSREFTRVIQAIGPRAAVQDVAASGVTWNRKPEMDFSDRVLKCVVCGKDFVFTADEQRFFHLKQFANDPKHCKECKARRVATSARSRPETRTVCAECGSPTTVPFRPNQGRPVLCRACFEKVRV
jgi:CxxC-x17-CxxC domain-containing protein